MASGLVDRGARVTVFSAAYPGAPAEEERDGIRFVRRGTKLTVYRRGMAALARGHLGRPDVVVDAQNGIPFFTRLVSRRPIVVLVHHVHREQWPVVYPGIRGRIGWWIESRLAPRLYASQQYVTGSIATRDELVRLGVDPERIAIVHYGTDRPPPSDVPKSSQPQVCVVGRLVPHKQVEHAIDAVAELRQEIPDLTLTVVGSGWWEDRLHEHARKRGAGDYVRFTGQVDEATKERVYEQSWVQALPSLKEGWGLVVGEAALAGTPTIAYAAAGGTRESISDGVSGLLVDGYPELVSGLRKVLTDTELRRTISEGAREMGGRFAWSGTRDAFARVVVHAALDRERPMAGVVEMTEAQPSSVES
jgi:glycosyltransferase involved in cell wall biosynthesis